MEIFPISLFLSETKLTLMQLYITFQIWKHREYADLKAILFTHEWMSNILTCDRLITIV